MTPKSNLTSHSKFLSLTNTESLSAYCLLLDKVIGSPNKYNIVNNDIEYDPFGNPYVIFQYYEKPEEEERKIKKMSFFAEIVDVHDLERYDSLVNSHLKNDIKFVLIKNCVEKLKDNFRIYYILIYIKALEGYIIDEGELKKIAPKEKTK
jgi:hypothetical protein